MKFSKKKIILVVAPFVVYALVGAGLGIATLVQNQTNNNANNNTSTINDDDYEFVFRGSVTTGTDRTFNLILTGNKDTEQTLDLTVQEMPALSIDGTWTFTEKKGYKIFLNDSIGTFAYSRYNTETKTFTVSFDYDMGNFGQPRAVLTCVNEEFANEYDGVGLGLKPPTFAVEGYTTFNHYSYGTIAFREDGSVSATLTNTGAGGYFNRTGVWSYDEANNVYDYYFTDTTISLTDGNLNIRSDEEGNQYVWWTQHNKITEQTEFRIQLSYDDFVNQYHLFTGEEYTYHAAFNEEHQSYYAVIDVQYNWGLNTGDIVQFSGFSPLADMEG